jgi:hypothetical protein
LAPEDLHVATNVEWVAQRMIAFEYRYVPVPPLPVHLVPEISKNDVPSGELSTQHRSMVFHMTKNRSSLVSRCPEGTMQCQQVPLERNPTG